MIQVERCKFREVMKKYFFGLLFQISLVASVSAADTSYIVLRVRGLELVPQGLDKGHFFQQQLMSLLQRELRNKSALIISSDDSEKVAAVQFNFAIEINILELHLNDPIINELNSVLSRDVHSNTYKDEAEDLRKEEARVTAEITITEKLVTGILRINAATLKLPEMSTNWNDVFVESYNWENKSATYTGSLQALGIKEKQLIKARALPVPKQELIYRELVQQFVKKASGKIINSMN